MSRLTFVCSSSGEGANAISFTVSLRKTKHMVAGVDDTAGEMLLQQDPPPRFRPGDTVRFRDGAAAWAPGL